MFLQEVIICFFYQIIGGKTNVLPWVSDPKQYKEEYLKKFGGSETPKTCLQLPAILSTYR